MTQTIEDLKREHMELKHETRPAFGCPSCIRKRDAFWVCACDIMNSPQLTFCEFCQSEAPNRIIELSLVPNITPIKVESSR